MRYKYLFFDLDGTLTKSENGILESAMYALEKLGKPVPEKETLMRFLGPPLFYSFNEIAGLEEDEAKEAVSLYRDYYEKQEAYKKAPLYDGVDRTLNLLKEAGCVLAVVTGKITPMAKKVLEINDILKYFSGIFGPNPDQKLPQKDDILRFAMETLEVTDKEKSLMIGDRNFDIEAAVEVGIDSVGCVYGYGERDELAASCATHLVYNPHELLSIVRGE